MSSTTRLRRPVRVAAAAAVALVALTACGDNADTAEEEGDGASAAEDADQGTQPDVNGDGDVVIGLLSPGDINDNGFYESSVVKAQEVVDEEGWELITVGSVNPADALEQARNMCRQGVDMVALATSELADAIPASEDEACAGTVWYMPTEIGGFEVTDRMAVVQSFPTETLLTAGYAMGLLLEGGDSTTVGFISGPELDFVAVGVDAFRAGLRQVIPDGDVVTTYTGDFDDSGLAVEAAQAQLGQGVGGLYPYLGGATDAAAQVGFDAGIPVATPGTDRCDEGTFAVSVVFDPGEFLAAALTDFAAGELALGETREWHVGVDPLPTVAFCDASAATDEQKQKLADFMTGIGDGTIDPEAEVERLGS